jgi:hypothetical protein
MPGQSSAMIPTTVSSSSWARLSEYLFKEISNARTARTHVRLGFGAAQLIIFLLGLYAGSRVILGYLQTTPSDTQRYYDAGIAEFVSGLMILIAIFASIWLMYVLHRISQAFIIAIAEELREKAAAFWVQFKSYSALGQDVPAEILKLLKEMGLDPKTSRAPT